MQFFLVVLLQVPIIFDMLRAQQQWKLYFVNNTGSCILYMCTWPQSYLSAVLINIRTKLFRGAIRKMNLITPDAADKFSHYGLNIFN